MFDGLRAPYGVMVNDDSAADGEPRDDVERLRDLFALGLIGGRSSDRFDRFTRIACHTYDVPIALVTMLDDSTQWFCASTGSDLAETDRGESFCTHLIDTDIDLLVVEDTHIDTRFADLGIVVGEPFVRFYAGAPIYSPAGRRVGTICILDVRPRSFGPTDRAILRDLADLVESEIRNVALSMTDELTGLPNLRAFQATVDRFMELGDRRDEPVTVMFADLDGLKEINDIKGHASGDDLLRRATATLLASIRSSDMVARVGGDEFAIVAYGLHADQTTTSLSAIETAVAASNAEAGVSSTLSISVGTATSTRGEDADGLIERADAAMYETKRLRAEGNFS